MARKRGAGRFRDKVEIWTESSTTFDSRGQTIQDSTLVYRTYAQIQPLRGTEGEYARKLTGTETHAITIRYTTFYGDITRQHQLRYDGRVFHIVAGVNTDNRGKYWELICGEDV